MSQRLDGILLYRKRSTFVSPKILIITIIIIINLDFETILIKQINAKRLAQRFDIVEMSLSSERINYKPHISTKIVTLRATFTSVKKNINILRLANIDGKNMVYKTKSRINASHF